MNITTIPFEEYDFSKNKNVYLKYTYSEAIEQSNWEGGENKRSSLKEGGGFTGTENFEEAYNIAVKGWQKGLEKIKDTDYNLMDKVKFEPLIEMRNEKYGSYVDMGKYLQGHPECMMLCNVKSISRRIEIIATAGFNFYGTEEDFFNYGKRVVSIIDYCEKNNIRVKLTVRWCTGYGNNTVIFEVKLKDYGEFLDLNRIAFAVCHRSFQRRVLFSLAEKQDSSIVRYFGFHSDGGYSSTKNLYVTKDEEANCLCIDRDSNTFFNNDEKLILNIESKIR